MRQASKNWTNGGDDMTSLKGVVFGSPEYVRIVKDAEAVGENTQLIGVAEKSIDKVARCSVDITYEQRESLRNIRRDIDEILGDRR